VKFDNPAWRSAPVRTGLKVAQSLARRAVPRLSRAVVPYDEGRSVIHADLHTPMGLMLYRYGHRDPDVDLVGRLLAPGDVFVDGGANVGLFTLVAADRVGPTGKVVAVEPGRTIRLRLLENVVINRLTQVEVIPFALSSGPGQASFRVFEISGAGLNHLSPTDSEGGALETVALITLDALLIPHDRSRLALIKLDLEGAEHAALLGAGAILREQRPDLLLEVEPAHLRRMGSSPTAIAELLSPHGYRFFRIGGDQHGVPFLVPVADISAPSKQPNIFATVDPDRAIRRGVTVQS
jgi:FkbM family methyltransferase